MVAYRWSRSVHYWVFALLVACVVAVELWIVHSAYFPSEADILSLGITLDIVLGIPALYYAFIIRRTSLPVSTVVPVAVLSFFLATALLPSAHHRWLEYIQIAFPLVELAFVGYVLFKARTLFRAYREARQHTPYVIDAMESAVRRVLHTTARTVPMRIVLMEVQMLCLSFAGWWKKFAAEGVHGTVISYYRSNGYPAVMGVLLMVAVVETVGVHFLLMQWSGMAAWIASALSLYGILWLLGDFHAQRLHPIIVTNSFLHIRSGMRWKADIPTEHLLSVHRATSADVRREGYLNVAATGTASLTLHFAEPIVFRGLFGMQKRASVVGIAVDSVPNALAVLGSVCSEPQQG